MPWAKGVAAALIAAGSAAAWAAGAPPERGPVPHAPARAAQTNPIVSGTVVNATRRPVVGAEVDLDLLDVSSGLKVVPTIHVATAKTDARGRFRLFAEQTAEMKRIGARNDGWLNLDLLVLSGNLALDRSAPRKLEGTRWVAPDYLSSGSVDVGTLVLAKGRPGVGVLRGKVALFAPAGTAQICTESTTTDSSEMTLPTPVGEVHRAQAGAVFRYGPTASTGVDKAVRWAGGVWSLASKVHIGNAYAAPAVPYSAALNAHREVRGPFVYRRYRTVFGAPCSTTRYTIKALRWGSKTTSSPGTVGDPSSGCTVGPYNDGAHKSTYAAGSTFTRSSGAARGFPKTVDLQPAFGAAIKVGSQSNYQPAHVEAQWTFGSSGSLCGSNGFPGAAPRIFAGS